ncbi:MAG: VCBS repeat-containing protein [Planctomycetes bacterium]|nr:VCBS repeat-containing protein [Planctomycetota bacterium]
MKSRSRTFAFLVVASALGAVSPARSQIQLDSVTSLPPVAPKPNFVVGADMDRDGIDDLLVAHLAPTQSLEWLHGTGTRELSATSEAYAPNVQDACVADLNGDGWLDYAWVRFNGLVKVHLGSAGGMLGPVTNVATVASPNSIAAADIDGDGTLDLVVPTTTGAVSVLRGNGSGGFTLIGAYSCGNTSFDVHTADIDGDGFDDVLLGGSAFPRVGVMRGAPSGLLPISTLIAGAQVYAIDTGDLDGDGDIDLVATGDSLVSIFLGDGAGGFASPVLHVVGAVSRAVAIADVTGDGLSDIVVSKLTAGLLSVLENRGGGVFTWGAEVPVHGELSSLATGDFDGDGRIDVALGNPGSQLAVWVAWGPLQAIHERDELAPQISGALRIAAGDLDGDGSPDVVSSGPGTGIRWHRRTPGAWDVAGQAIAGPSRGDGLALFDVDGDQRLDVLTSDYATGMGDVFLGTPGGAPLYAFSEAVGTFSHSFALAEFDGDGLVDRAAIHYDSGTVTVGLGTGGGHFASFATYAAVATAVDVTALDVEGDGDIDLAISASAGSPANVVVLRNQGGGTFSSPVAIHAQASNSVEASDLDGDGDQDLLIVTGFGREAVMLLNDGTGAFTDQHVRSGCAFALSAHATDLDRDGDLDVVVCDPNGDSVGLIEQHAPGQWRYAGQERVLDAPRDVTSSDFDGDGVRDLAVLSSATFASSCVTVLRGAHARFGDVVPYCTATVNSLGCTPELNVVGVPSASSPQACTLLASSELNQRPGLLFYGSVPAALPFGSGWRCVASPLRRTPAQLSGGSASGNDCSGSYAFDWNALVRSGADPALTAGSTHFAQFWSRDGASSTGFNFTSAVQLVIAP